MLIINVRILKMNIRMTNDNKRTNGPVNAHLIFGPNILSTKHTKPI